MPILEEQARNEMKIERYKFMIVQISAGQGPAECQLAVAKLFEALKREYGNFETLSETKGHERGCLDSIRFRTEHDLSGLAGTVLWIYAKTRSAETIRGRTGMWM